jgi:hypothetical protein
MDKYLVDFNMDGETYSHIIEAESLEDAERRLRCIKANGRLIGGPAFTIPVPNRFESVVLAVMKFLGRA